MKRKKGSAESQLDLFSAARPARVPVASPEPEAQPIVQEPPAPSVTSLAPVIPLFLKRQAPPEVVFAPPEVSGNLPPVEHLSPVADDGSGEVVSLEEALRLERNVALFAGAGAGKTFSLVTMALHALAGAREGHEPVPPNQLTLVTFTDKAAGELRGRLRARIDLLAEGRADEPALERSLQRLGRSLPPPTFWQRLRDSFQALTVGTFHTLCAGLLRGAGPGAAVDPGFALLDELEGRSLLRRVIEDVVLQALERGDQRTAALTRQFDFGGPEQSGLVDALLETASRIREEGHQPHLVRVADEAQALATYESLLQQARYAARVACAELAKTTSKQIAKAQQFEQGLWGLTHDSFEEKWPRLVELSRHFSSQRVLAPLTQFTQQKEHQTHLGMAFAALRMAPFENTIRSLLSEAVAAHQSIMKQRRVLDFTGLLVAARDLLRDTPAARAEAQSRHRVLLVDEFQDTNRLQLELVLLLAEQRSGAPRPVSSGIDLASPEVLSLPLEPGCLAVVGDRKQSIYEFRGADVTAFQTLAKKVGARAYLSTSRRASGPLVEALNGLMPMVLGRQADYPFQVAFTDQEALVAVRTDGCRHAPLVHLKHGLPEGAKVDAWLAADARAVAQYLAVLLGPDGESVVAGPRQARPSDVAMLFQRFTHLDVYRSALLACGVPHRVVRGRGFFGSQEVLDLAMALTLVGRPDDALAWAAVLRSPLVGVRDETLLRLAEHQRWRSLDVTLLDDDERPRYELLRDCLEQLWREGDRLSPAAMLERLISATSLMSSLAAAPFGEQAVANVEKLIRLARSSQAVPPLRFAGELRRAATSEPNEAHAETDIDEEAVTLCTVHQAKGLEWPVVVLPDLNSPRPPARGVIRFERDFGLALAGFDDDDERVKSRPFEQIKERQRLRHEAEWKRLLYVAATRARDLVVWGLIMPTSRGWGGLASDPTGLPSLGVKVVDVESLQLPVAPVAQPPSVQAVHEVERIVARVRSSLKPHPRQAILPVTQLQDYVDCPRRYQLAHVVGLPEPTVSGPGPGGGKERGVQLHSLLARVALAGGPQALDATLRQSASSTDPQVVEWARRFLQTPYGQGLADADEVHRELPFVVALDDGAGFYLTLRGQIDLLVRRGMAVDVVDYKTSQRSNEGPQRYAIQVSAYAAAARRLFEGEVTVRAGVVFVADDDPQPAWLSAAVDGQTLAAVGRELATQPPGDDWPTRDPRQCNALGCAYVSQCHGPGGRL